MYIQLKSTPLKSSNSFLSSTLLSLPYNEKVETIEQKDGWVKVKVKGKTGWLHSNALNKEQLKLAKATTQAPQSVSSKEVTMAAKGFSAEVEKEYKKDNPKLPFSLVDKIEKPLINLAEQRKFVDNGGLNR